MAGGRWAPQRATPRAGPAHPPPTTHVSVGEVGGQGCRSLPQPSSHPPPIHPPRRLFERRGQSGRLDGRHPLGRRRRLYSSYAAAPHRRLLPPQAEEELDVKENSTAHLPPTTTSVIAVIVSRGCGLRYVIE